MVLFSWVDVITMAALAVWLVSFRTHPRVATFALVLALAAKPTTLIALVPMFFWSVRARRQVIIAGVVAAALRAAVRRGHRLLAVLLRRRRRAARGACRDSNSLTLNSYLNSYGLPILPFVVSALVVATAAVLVLRHRPRSYGELLTGTAVIATVSFLVAKWAYFNYYYIPAVLLVLAIAGNNLAVDTPEMIRPPAVLVSDRCAWWRASARAAVDRAPPRARQRSPRLRRET